MYASCLSSILLAAATFACVEIIHATATACFEPLGDGRPFAMAYRGASAAFPEHSIGAYRSAIQEGARFIECDVVLTSDLVPICRHEPNIAETTDVLAARRMTSEATGREGTGAEETGLKGAASGGGAASGSGSGSLATVRDGLVLASDLTLAEIKRLRAVFPGHAAVAAAAAATATASSPSAPARQCSAGTAADEEAVTGAAPEAVGQCAAEGSFQGPNAAARQAGAALQADEAAEAVDAAKAAESLRGRDVVCPDGACGGGPVRLAEGSDLRVASLEDLLEMAAAADPAVGVAVHIQSAAWHNALPQVKAQNTTFEDALLQLMYQYGYALGPYGSEAWRRRPSYLMAFEAGSLQYIAQRTTSPLTQVLGPTIPDTGETWDSATSSQGLRRIRSYAGSVAVARQQLLELAPAPVSGAVAEGAGNYGAACAGGLVASELLARMREAGLQVFASVFKPLPSDHLLRGALSWEDELAPLLLGSGLQSGAGGGAGGPRPAAIDGVFADSPAELLGVLQRLRCPVSTKKAAQ